MAIKLDEVIPWGRSFDEYRRMFALSDLDLAGRILGCGDGPASFNTEATRAGHKVVSCDPIYAFSAGEIQKRVHDCHDDMVSQVRKQMDGFNWTDFRDPEHLGQCRLAAMHGFLADFERGLVEGRYVVAALPKLPFGDNQFDLGLVSHLLFLYSGHLDFAFHKASIVELLRVAKEVRIFPLLTLERIRSHHLTPLLDELGREGVDAQIQTVAYEFQRGGNEMLKLRRDRSRAPCAPRD